MEKECVTDEIKKLTTALGACLSRKKFGQRVVLIEFRPQQVRSHAP